MSFIEHRLYNIDICPNNFNVSCQKVIKAFQKITEFMCKMTSIELIAVHERLSKNTITERDVNSKQQLEIPSF